MCRSDAKGPGLEDPACLLPDRFLGVSAMPAFRETRHWFRGVDLPASPGSGAHQPSRKWLKETSLHPFLWSCFFDVGSRVRDKGEWHWLCGVDMPTTIQVFRLTEVPEHIYKRTKGTHIRHWEANWKAIIACT